MKKGKIVLMGFKFVRWITKILLTLIASTEVTGWDNLPKQGSYIATANHAGRIEVLLIYYLLNRQDIILMIAEKYRQSAFWRWFARRVDGIFIDRYNADFTALRQVLKRLQAGGVLTMAPEGTRSASGTLQEAHWGAAFLAAKSGVPVVPVCVTGTYDKLVVERLKRFKRLKIRVRIGEPYTLPPLKHHDRETQLELYTDEIMCQIAALLPEELRGFYADHPRLKEFLKN
jgi:1-acyl-sn-glycerol-3-phosphate acyltransferase